MVERELPKLDVCEFDPRCPLYVSQFTFCATQNCLCCTDETQGQVTEPVDDLVSKAKAARRGGSSPPLATYARIAQLVEHRSYKPNAAGSFPAPRKNS